MNELLYNVRKTKKWSQDKLAKKAGINRTFYNQIEQGRTPNLRTAYKIAEALEVRVDDIFLPSDVLKQKQIEVL
jgi:DNA-binding XRE family transcriptional regulator